MLEEDVEMEDSAVDEDDGPVFKVDEILGTRVKKNVRYYKVRWTDTWETEENLHECQEAIDAFWERTGGKDKAKPPIVVNTEVPHTGKAYPLRQTEEEQSSKKKKRKGTSKKIQRLKKRKLQGQKSSSEEENGDESDNTDTAGGKSSLPSPQIGTKKVKRLRSKKTKNINKELFGSEEGVVTDDGDDGDDEDDGIPLKQLLTPASTTKPQGDANTMQAECPPKEGLTPAVDDATEDVCTTAFALASTENVSDSVQECESSGIPDDSLKPCEAVAALQGKEVGGTVPSAVDSQSATTTINVSAASTAISTTTTTGTATTTTTTISSESASIATERQKWCRLGRGSKGDSILCSSGSEDEERAANRAKFILPAEVKIKEEEKSEEEAEESFKRTAKIKASFVIRRYCETGGDMEVGEEEFVPPVSSAVIDDDDEVSENNVSNDSDYVPSPGSNSSLPIEAVTTTVSSPPISLSSAVTCAPSTMNIPINPYQVNHLTIPTTGQVQPLANPRVLAEYQRAPGIAPFLGMSEGIPRPVLLPNQSTMSPSVVPPLTTPQGSNCHVTSSGTTVNGNPQSTAVQQLSVKEEGEDVAIVSDMSLQHGLSQSGEMQRPHSPHDLVSHAVSKVATCRAVPCSRPVKYLSNEAVENLITRVLFYVKKLIEFLKLKPAQMPEHIQALITKSAVYTMGESYKGDKPQPDFLEQQINDLTQIVLKELPHAKLMPVVYQYALPNLNTPESAINAPVLSNSNVPPQASFLGTPMSPLNSLKQTLNTPAQVVNMASAGGSGSVRTVPPNVVVPPHMYAPQMMMANPTAPIAMLHPRADTNMQLRYPLMFPRPPAVNLGNMNAIASGARPSIIQVRPTQTAPIVNGSVPRMHIQQQQQQLQQHAVDVLPSSSAIIQNIMESPPPLNQINCVVPEQMSPDPSDTPMFNITSVRSLKLDPPQPRTKSTAVVTKPHAVVSTHYNSKSAVVNKSPVVLKSALTKSPIVSKTGFINSPVSKTLYKPTAVSKSLVSGKSPVVTKSVVAGRSSQIKSPPLAITSVATCPSSNTDSSTTVVLYNTVTVTQTPPTTTGTPKPLKSPEVKTVLGPHRFYKPPPKKTNSDNSGMASGSSEVIVDDDGNKSEAKESEKDENTRYKDKVNKKFAKPISDPNKVIDLTDLTVESEPEDEGKSQSEEDTEEEDS